MMNHHSNHKNIVLRLYREVLGQGNMALADELIAEEYVQHSAFVSGGKAALLAVIQQFQALPKPPSKRPPFLRLLAEGPFVVLHMKVSMGTTHRLVMELFRLADGKIIEHWDAIELIPNEATATERIEGTIEVEDLPLTAKNKELIQAFFQARSSGGQAADANSWLRADFQAHHPSIQAENFFSQESTRLQLHRLIGEGNFVFAQTEAEVAGKRMVLYEMFRLQDQLIAEYWRVQQTIPDKMPHENGMI